MRRSAFALLEVLIVAVIIAVVAGYGFYFSRSRNETAALPAYLPGGAGTLRQPEQYASSALQQYVSTTQNEQGILDNLQSAQPETAAN